MPTFTVRGFFCVVRILPKTKPWRSNVLKAEVFIVTKPFFIIKRQTLSATVGGKEMWLSEAQLVRAAAEAAHCSGQQSRNRRRCSAAAPKCRRMRNNVKS